MPRLHIVVEGQSEETFVNRIMREPLAYRNVFVDARCVQTSRKQGHKHRGGLLKFAQASGDLKRWMDEDQNPDVFFTTMFDLYHLPLDFPGYSNAKRKREPNARVRALEAAFAAEVGHPRFIPHIQLHEFEALLLCGPGHFQIPFPEQLPAVRKLEDMARGFASPELIDDGDKTSPSRRIIAELPGYEKQKVRASAAVSARIGLQTMRAKCPHFAEWLERIEGLGEDSSVPRQPS